MAGERGEFFAGLMTRALLTAVLVFVLALASLMYTRQFGHLAAVWPPNAMAVAALLRVETKRWPLFVAAGMIGLFAALLVMGGPFWPMPLLALCNGFEMVICAAGIRMALGRDIDLTRGRQLLVYVLVAGVAAPLVSAVPASLVLSVSKHGPASRFLTEWFASTALGLLILTPALMAVTPASLAGLIGKGRTWRSAALASLLAACLAVVFLQTRLYLLFLVMPVLMLITFQLELAGGALAVLITVAVAVSASVLGRGPALERGGLLDQLLLVQLFLAVTTLSVLAAAAVLGHQRRLMTSLRTALAEADAARADAQEHQRWAAMAEEMAGVGHWRLDRRTEETVWSAEVFRIYGLDPAAGIPDPITLLEMYHPDDRALVATLFNAARREGRPFTGEVRIVRPDGGIRHLLCRGAAEFGPNGKVSAVFGAFMDVTEAKRAEQVLRESEERYRMLTERATDIIIRYDTAAVIEFASPAVRQLGYEPDDVIGRNMAEFIDPEGGAFGPDGRTLAATGVILGEAEQPDVRARRADGEWVWLQGSPAPIRDEAGEVIGVVTVLRDVSARRAMEQELRRRQIEAEVATQAKSDFLANMSHEIRTPLTAIIGFSGLLQRIDHLPEKARRYVQRIVTGGQTLLEVVNDILDFSKLEAGQVELDPHSFNPAALVDGAMALVAAQAAAKGLDLGSRLDVDLPASLEADSSRARQVLLNLLTNAIKFTDAGAVTVFATYLAGEQRLRLAVADTGCGIPEDKLDRLFERFSQVDGSVSRRHGGTGLGLSICKNLVELMGGEIELESVQGSGSTFSFTIPAPLTVARREREAAAPMELAAASEPAHVLIVDDLPANRELVRVLLEAMGHTVKEVSNGDAAVAAAIGSRFDLILMDLQMPGMDGAVATRRIREASELNRRTPIVALSANVLADQVAQCYAAGMNDHIAKPIKLEELVEKVARWAGQARAERGHARVG